MFNKAKWITANFYPDMFPNNADSIVRSAYLRKEFILNKAVKSAQLIICALGLGVYYINGKKVTEDVLATPYTAYDKRVICSKYPVTDLVKEGKNCIAVHLGNGFYNNNMESWKDKMAPWRDVPKVILSLHVIYSDETEEYIDSDKTFKTKDGPVLFNHMRQGEVYDARFEAKGFCEYGFDDGDWEYAKRANHPGGVYDTTTAPPIRIKEEYKPVDYKNGIYDFGVNISGWVQIKVKGERGRKITLSYDECLSDDGTDLYAVWKFPQLTDEERPHWRASNALVLIEGLEYAHKDEYILKGGDEEIWTPTFCYHGFRYVKVENAPADFEITAQFVHTDLETVGTFECSDDILNKIHDLSIRATLSNNVGIPTDCPHREQNGWPGDARLASRQMYLNFDVHEYFKNWIINYKDVQRPSGQIPCLIPTASWGFNWGSSSITDSAVIMFPYFAYLYTGKTETAEQMWDAMTRFVRYMDKEVADEDGIIEYGLPSDWSCSNLLHPCPIAAVDTAALYDDCIHIAKLAKAIGKDDGEWLELAEKYKSAWRREFLHRTELRESQTFLANALYYGVLEGEEIKKAADELAELIKKQDYHFNCGVCGVSQAMFVLSDNGYTDVVYKAITNKTYPSYAYWVYSGLTALAEDWDMSQSKNHQMFSEVDRWLYNYLGGIKHTDNGVLIEPLKIEGIDYVKATHKGIIVERNGSNVKVTLPHKAKIKIGNTEEEVLAGEYEFEF